VTALVVVVGCGSAKRAMRSRARDLYTGALTRGACSYASDVADLPLIVSALYGLVPFDHELQPYDRRVEQHDAEERARWRQSVSASLREASGRAPWARFDAIYSRGERLTQRDVSTMTVRYVVLAGRAYVDAMRPELAREIAFRRVSTRAAVDVVLPLAGLQLGQRLQWFARRRGQSPDVLREELLQLAAVEVRP
jgi:hypothetical protein